MVRSKKKKIQNFDTSELSRSSIVVKNPYCDDRIKESLFRVKTKKFQGFSVEKEF